MKLKLKPIKLADGERVIAVVPEYVSGPGWSNMPTYVYIRTSDGLLREECIQPEDMTPAIATLFAPGAAMCRALLQSIPIIRKKARQ